MDLRKIYFKKKATELMVIAAKCNRLKEIEGVIEEFTRRFTNNILNKKNKSVSWVNRRSKKLVQYIHAVNSIKESRFLQKQNTETLSPKNSWYEVFRFAPDRLHEIDGSLTENIDDPYNKNIFYIGKYIPTRKLQFATNADDIEFSKKLLAIKDRKIKAIEYFTNILTGLINQNGKFIITTVPSSTQDNANAIDIIAKNLSSEDNFNIANGSAVISFYESADKKWVYESDTNLSVIKRIISLEKKSTGGVRDANIEYKSVSINSRWLDVIKGKIILLLDDIITSGTSIQACKKKLIENGAHRVICLALGRTVSFV